VITASGEYYLFGEQNIKIDLSVRESFSFAVLKKKKSKDINTDFCESHFDNIQTLLLLLAESHN